MMAMVAEPILAQRAMLVAHVASLKAEGKVKVVVEPILAQCAMHVARAVSPRAEGKLTMVADTVVAQCALSVAHAVCSHNRHRRTAHGIAIAHSECDCDAGCVHAV